MSHFLIKIAYSPPPGSIKIRDIDDIRASSLFTCAKRLVYMSSLLLLLLFDSSNDLITDQTLAQE